MRAVVALRRELEAVWGTTLTRQRNSRKSEVIIDRIESLAKKGDCTLHNCTRKVVSNLQIEYTGAEKDVVFLMHLCLIF